MKAKAESHPESVKPLISVGDPFQDNPFGLYVGRLILRPAKITPSEFTWLDPLMNDSRDPNKIVLHALPGRERGYFANGYVVLSTGEDRHGLAVITKKVGWRDDWGCLEIVSVAKSFVKAIVSPIPKEEVKKYYQWVFSNPAILNTDFDVWKSKVF